MDLKDWRSFNLYRRYGQTEAVSKKYFKYEGKSGRTWLVADQPNAADNIYCSNPGNGPGNGFGGAKLSLALVEGGFFVLNGGWHSNSDSLFRDTGIDLRSKHLTQVVVGRNRTTNSNHETIITDVLYWEKEPLVGSFYRYKEICDQVIQEYNLDNLVYYMESQDGSSCGWYKSWKPGDANAPGPVELVSEAETIALHSPEPAAPAARVDLIPSEKTEEIDLLLSNMTGRSRRHTIASGLCMCCGLPVGVFRDALSVKEYTISGYCQGCQDAVFTSV
jgi:hypothetical protein